MQCPVCKLENPPGAEACDCGFNFAQQRVVWHESPRYDSSLSTIATLKAIWIILGLILPIVALGTWLILPLTFLIWSGLALPLAVGTVVWAGRLGFRYYRYSCYLGFVSWLCLLAVFWLPPAGNRDQQTIWFFLMEFVYGAASLAILILMLAFLSKVRQHLMAEPIAPANRSPATGSR